jgi:hypothetical protein
VAIEVVGTRGELHEVPGQIAEELGQISWPASSKLSHSLFEILGEYCGQVPPYSGGHTSSGLKRCEEVLAERGWVRSAVQAEGTSPGPEEENRTQV